MLAQTTNAPPSAPKPIPASEIAYRSEELILSLATISKNLAQDKTLAEMQETLNERYGRLQEDALETRKLLGADPTSIDLRVQERRWRRLGLLEKSFAAKLTEQANVAISGIRTLDAEEAKWKATLESISQDLKSKPLQQIVVRTIDKIGGVRRQAQDQVTRTVTLQERAADALLLIPQVQKEIATAEESYREQLLVQDGEPIWRSTPDAAIEATTAPPEAVGRNAQMISEFARTRSVTVLVSATSFFLVVLFLYRVRRKARRPAAEPREAGRTGGVAMEHPLAVAFILQLPFLSALLPDAPPNAIALVILISIVPVLQILLHHTRHVGRAAYLGAGFYAAGAILDFIPVGSPMRRAAFLAFLAIAAATLAVMMRTRALRAPDAFGRATRTVKLAAVLVMSGTLAALCASLFGYLSLAQFLRQGILLSSYLALLLSAWVRVMIVLFEVVYSRLSPSTPSRDSVVGLWFGRVLRTCGFAVWLLATVNLLLLATPAMRISAELLKTGLPGRLSGVTLGDLAECAAVLASGWLLARAVRFVLREGVLGRIKLERGIPDLISNLVYYVLLLLVFVASVKALGVDLSKLTLLTGAFGVGIGFGMQNVLNNFFSGLILQAERPIHLGDVIEVAGQIGEVQRIGVRSTTIRTPVGSELIVPNANLVSNNVVNWTVTRSGWHISLPILVGGGVAAENIIPLLVDAAEGNPAVLREPQPTAYLKNSVANGSLFELSFSVDPSVPAERVRRNVAKAAVRALSRANVAPYQMAH
jgi:small-conductance mechanosensitive channel